MISPAGFSWINAMLMKKLMPKKTPISSPETSNELARWIGPNCRPWANTVINAPITSE